MKKGIAATAVVLALVACTKKEGGDKAPATPRKLPPNLEAAARSFGDAVLAKNYPAAYALMSASYKQANPYDEFLKSIGRYRDAFEEGQLKLSVRASDDDPAALKDDAMVQMLVPEGLRGQILGEAILDFDPPEEGDAEGWVLVMWLVDEAGQIHVLNYYQDD